MSDQDLALPLCNQMTPPIQSPDFFTKISFYGLSPISAYLSLLLIIGYIKFPSLRERPGDLILGIAISNLVLSIHWTLSISLESLVDNSTGCYASGMVAVFAGFLNYVYSIAFVHYLKQKLQNLLKKSRISNKINVHLLCVILSVAFTAYLIIEAEIGQNLFYTCSKRFSCNPSYIAATIAVIFYLSYEFFAVYLYVFIKRSFRQAISSSGEAKLFLDNYQGYLILSTLLYLGIVLGHIYSEYAGGYNMNLLVYIIPVHNACKVLQGILITIYRYRDPIVRHAMTRLIFFWKTGKESSHSHGKTTPSLKEISIDDGEAPTGLNEPLTSSDHLARSSKSLEQTNIYDSFAKKRKLELTYSVLTSAMISYLDQNDIPEQPLSTSERTKQVLTYEVNENFASVLIPNLKRKLSEAGCQIAPVRMTVIAPSIFKEFVNRDFGLNNILETFDLEANSDEIRKEASEASVKGGKSGEFFFYLKNRKLLIKSISSKEMSVLLKILGDYYEHIKNNPESLIVRLFGVLKLEWGSQCLNLIIMRNVCPYPEECIERGFDIKGSTYDRTVLKKSSINNLKKKTLKDVDFLKLNEKIKVNEAKRRRIFEALKKDSLFLQQAGLMDYSLMIFVVQTGGDLGQLNRNILYLEEVENSSVPMEGNPSICYHFGVIDLLQTYTMKKRMEKFGKKLINFNPWLDTSAQDCTTYRNRFVAFIRRIFEISEDNICDTEHNEPVL